jgi:hypothetical protein
MSARGVPVVRVDVKSWSGSWGRVVSELAVTVLALMDKTFWQLEW